MTALMFEFSNLWGWPFFELQMAFFDKESSHKLVSLGYPFFLNPESKTIDFFLYRYELAFPSLLSLMSQIVKTHNLVNLGILPQKMPQTAVGLPKFSIWKYHYSYGICFAPCYALQNSTPNISIPNILNIFFIT